MAKIEFLEEVDDDFSKIPEKVKVEVNKYLSDLQKNPFFGKKMERELKGCYAIYLHNATYRIVYQVRNSAIKIVLIIAVGARAESEVYRIAKNRLNKYGL